MSESFLLLADRPAATRLVARWYFEQWGHRRPGESEAATFERLSACQNRDRIPLIMLALDDDRVVGAAQLKFREMEMFPEREHWLGGVFVESEYRGRGLAARLVQESIRQARRLGVEILHLQTERLDGGIYARLGWRPSQRAVNHDGIEVLVMELPLASA
jgi:GNAT superfamily N-acetyltransferase